MQRTSGILLHPTSLSGPLPIGDLGKSALMFVDFLVKSGQSVWQILPMGPTGYGHSPYNALSAFAGNPAIIDLGQLVEYGDLDPESLTRACLNKANISFAETHDIKQLLLKTAGRNFFANASSKRHHDFNCFCETEADWLEGFCLFMAIKEKFDDQPWYNWPSAISERHHQKLAELKQETDEACKLIQYQQFIFAEQWQRVKNYANDRGIKIFGDIPIFVAYDSADVWANQHLFQLNEHGKATAVAGVPPDYFSKTGQRWGNPLYKWGAHLADDFSWWLKRFSSQLKQCDMVRIDHFRGFEACWAIPADENTAINGRWEKVPGRELFTKLMQSYKELPIIAEDLGVITEDVEKLRDDFGFPGMNILQFAFDSGAGNPYLPENHVTNSVVYTGTHDNATTLGWWQGLSKKQKDIIRDYLGTRRPNMPWEMIRLAMSSVANLCIVPLQDILSLDNHARLNRPGHATGNWQWQLGAEMLTDELAYQLKEITEKTARIKLH
jgi:4-alpha-glucanotransferase